MKVIPTIINLTSSVLQIPSLVIPSTYIGQRLIIQVNQTNPGNLDNYFISSSNNTYDLVDSNFVLNTSGGGTKDSVANMSIFTKISDGDDDLTLNCTPSLNSHATAIAYVVSDSPFDISFTTLSNPESTDPIAPALDIDRKTVYFTLVNGSAGNNNNIEPPITYTKQIQINNSVNVTASAYSSEILSIPQGSWTNQESRWRTYTLALISIPTKITIGISNSLIVTVDGDNLKDNLIIKQ